MAYPIGIDLGTTNSVACVWRRGGLETVSVDGRPIMPSAISTRQDGTVLVGQAAKSRVILEPTQSVTSAKRNIGDGKTQWQISNKIYTPVDVSALILSRLKTAAEVFLAQPVTEAVIAVPAYFNTNQKRDTKIAAEAAGLRVLQLLPEPTAAAISYGLDKGKEQTILVYDLGGGTFDVSVLTIEGNRFQVVAVDGDSYLGGDDFDILLVEHLIGMLQQRTKADLGFLQSLVHCGGKQDLGSPREMLVARQRLKEAAEKAKIELSESEFAWVSIPEILGTSLEEEISLSTYNRLIVPLVDQTITKIRGVLKASHLTVDDIDRVVLVGGSTRNKLVRERIAEAIKEPWLSDRVDEVVAQGAAIVANYLSSLTEDLTPVEFHNVTPFSLGVRASKGSEIDLFQVLIPKNTSIPIEVEHEFTTFQTNQKSVDISVFQGEQQYCKENTFIGGFQLKGIPPAPAGQPKVSVRFKMDKSDLLAVTASCNHLRNEQTLDIDLISREDDMPRSSPQADIIFLIDTSGSMSEELEGVKRSCLDLAKRVMEAGIDCRLGLVDFDKPCSGDVYKWEVFRPIEPARFPGTISGLKIGRLGGCGCYIGEVSSIPVVEAFVRSFSSQERLKIGILISDEAKNDTSAVQQSISILKQAQVCLYVLGVSQSCHEQIAHETGGQFWGIAESRGHVDFSDLLEAIAVEITNLALR